MAPGTSNKHPGEQGEAPIPFRLSLGAEGGDGPAPLDEETLAAFRQAAWLNPEEADYHYILGEALLHSGRFVEAAAAFEEATWRAPAEPQYQIGLGLALFALRRHVEAVSAFREAVRLAPRDPRAQDGLGASLVVLGQTGEGIRSLGQAVVLAPSSADAQFNLGIAFAATQQATEALAPLRQATTLRPGDALALAELGGALHGLGRHDEAHKALGEALRIDSRCLDPHPSLRAAHDASTMVVLKEGLREDVSDDRSPWRWAFRPVVAVVERFPDLPDLPRGIGAVLSLFLLALATYVTLRLVPPYWDHYALKDDIAVIGHAAVRDDSQIRARVIEAAERHHVGRFVQEGELTIETRKTWRRITCSYRVPVALLPGLEPRLHFSLDVEQPVLIDGEEKIFF